MTTTFETVHNDDARLAQMQEQIATLTAEAEGLDSEIAGTLAAGHDASKARAKRAEVRSLASDLAEAVARLQVQRETDREAAGTAVAEAYCAGAPKRHATLLRTLDVAQGQAREAATRLTQALTTVYAAGHELDWDGAAMKLLAVRFGVTAPAARLSPVPAPEQLLKDVLAFLTRPTRRPPPFDVHGVGVGAPPEEHQAARWRALSSYVARHGPNLPAEVRDIFAASGIPTPEESERSKQLRLDREESERQFAKESQRYVAPVTRHGV